MATCFPESSLELRNSWCFILSWAERQGKCIGLLLWVWPQFTSPSREPHAPALYSVQLSGQRLLPSLCCDCTSHPLSNQQQPRKPNHRTPLWLITWQVSDHCNVGFLRNISQEGPTYTFSRAHWSDSIGTENIAHTKEARRWNGTMFRKNRLFDNSYT